MKAKMMKRVLAGLGIVVITSSGTWAINDNVGTSSAPFLRMDVGARYVGLGGAGTGHVDDAYALHYNAAAMRSGTNFAFQHNEYFQDMNQEYLAVTMTSPFREEDAWGVSVNYFNTADDIPRTTETTGGLYGGQSGTFGASDIAVNVGYSYGINTTWRIGASLKYIRSEIDSFNASTFAFDLGTYHEVESIEGLTVGASVLNLGQGLKFIRERDDLPLTFRAGGAYRFWDERILLALDVVKPRDNDFGVSVGGELRLIDFFAARLGYNSLQDDADNGLSVGAGFNYEALDIDYAYVPFGDLGNAHRISANYKFN